MGGLKYSEILDKIRDDRIATARFYIIDNISKLVESDEDGEFLSDLAYECWRNTSYDIDEVIAAIKFGINAGENMATYKISDLAKIIENKGE